MVLRKSAQDSFLTFSFSFEPLFMNELVSKYPLPRQKKNAKFISFSRFSRFLFFPILLTMSMTIFFAIKSLSMNMHGILLFKNVNKFKFFCGMVVLSAIEEKYLVNYETAVSLKRIASSENK